MITKLSRVLMLALILTVPAHADDFAGTVRVIDADTIDVGETRVRLFGIDAPEMAQSCPMPDGTEWFCGRWAADEVRRLYEGQIAACDTRDIDRYGRVVAVCWVDGDDLSAVLAETGLAFAYERYALDYVDAAKRALFREAGLWRSRATHPADFRAATRASADIPPPDPTCAIKGNISRNGKIYHMPWNADYDATRINTAKGEHWFCTEAEARAAGWRPARN